MTENPAVRAVAAGGCTRKARDFPVRDHCTPVLRHPECAVAALASSQEVREWLVEEVAAALYGNGTVDEKVHFAEAADVAADSILHALGGGE